MARLKPTTAVLLPLLVGSCSAVRLPSRRLLLKGLGGAVVGLPLAYEAYARAPSGWREDELPALPLAGVARADRLVIVVPGAGGPDANTERIARALGADGSLALVYDWSAYTGDTARAPHNAQRVGRHLGSQLAAAADALSLARLHVVGVSVGAFAADALLQTFAAKHPPRAGGGGAKKVATRATFLDPFTARGLGGLVAPDSAYGVSTFGSAADEALCVLNTDDPVPSTSTPLRHAANLDVTSAALRQTFVPLPGDDPGHSWPAAWYGLSGTSFSPGELPARGEVRSVP